MSNLERSYYFTSMFSKIYMTNIIIILQVIFWKKQNLNNTHE